MLMSDLGATCLKLLGKIFQEHMISKKIMSHLGAILSGKNILFHDEPEVPGSLFT